MWWSGMVGLLSAIILFVFWLFGFALWWLGIPFDEPPVYSLLNYALACAPLLGPLALAKWSLKRIDRSLEGS